MNRRQRIIVSIIGIVLVSLILIGLTYAYFLTRITGNTNDKSISATTANLEIKYEDNNDIITGDKIQPGVTLPSKTFTVTNNGNSTVDYSVGLVNIINTFTNTKDVVYNVTCTSYKKDGFTLSTTGEVTGTVSGTCSGKDETEFPTLNSYIVNNSIDINIVHAYTITVTYKETGTDQSIDMNKTLEAKIDIFDPKSLTIKGNVTNSSENDYVVIHSKEQESNIINGKYQFIGITPDNHTISIKNRDTSTSTSTTLNVSKGTPSVSSSNIVYDNEKNVANMDININDNNVTLDVTKIGDGTYTLGETILISAKAGGTNRTIYSETPLTKPAKEINGENERTLSKTVDDYGDSYYFRGNVLDNYVNFANKCWKIVRIEGDGSIKLILEDYNTTCNSSTYTGNWSNGNTYMFGYDSNKRVDFLNYSSGLVDALKTFQKTKMSNYLDKLEIDNWCYDDNVVGISNPDKDEYYGAYKRIYTDKSPSLVCNGTKLTKYKDGTSMYVGILTADEISFAGGNTTNNNPNFYLINNYQKNNSLYWWTLSPSSRSGVIHADSSFRLNSGGKLDEDFVSDVLPIVDTSARFAVTLNPNTLITGGNGTIKNPYVVE